MKNSNFKNTMEYSYTLYVFLLLISIVTLFETKLVSALDDNNLLEQKYGEIQHISVIFRHGERSPMASYPLDLYRDYPWPGGFGQLLNKGKKRLFDLGQWFGGRYTKLTGTEYDRERIFVQSSDIDRTIMSALSFLRGLYPANGSQVWLEKEKWQPIPVHTIPAKYDNMIHSDPSICPRWKMIKRTHYESMELKKIYDEHNETLKYIEEHSGLELSKKTRDDVLDILDDFRDALLVEAENNLTLPDWTQKVYPEPLQSIFTKLKITNGIIHREDMRRIVAGPLLKSITSDMVKKMKSEDFKQKVHIYSGHDLTIFRMLYGLGAYPADFEPETVLPPYGAMLTFELRRNISDYLVTLSYTSITRGSILLQIPNCGEVCPLEKFLQITKTLIPVDWNKECQVESGSVRISLSWCSLFIPLFYFILF